MRIRPDGVIVSFARGSLIDLGQIRLDGVGRECSRSSTVDCSIRTATLADVEKLAALIALSARSLGRAFYSDQQIEAALGTAWGVDTQLIRDGTFFVSEAGNQWAGCGGWSWRKTLFGADQQQGREASALDPRNDAARIRAFFVHPNFARHGIGRRLLGHCEAAAREHGFKSAELVATLPGEPFYRRFGYAEVERINHPLRDAVSIEFVRMRKEPL
jgi:GNAT superfamily N-acetyltransferase